jgi:hypothetical protein
MLVAHWTAPLTALPGRRRVFSPTARSAPPLDLWGREAPMGWSLRKGSSIYRVTVPEAAVLAYTNDRREEEYLILVGRRPVDGVECHTGPGAPHA